MKSHILSIFSVGFCVARSTLIGAMLELLIREMSDKDD